MLARLLLFTLAAEAAVLPKDFAWGTATAAFQVEGAWNISGRGPSVWDDFQEFPGVIHNNDKAYVADDFYHRYPEDIELLKWLGTKTFRISISWSRVLPTGDIDNVNQAGVDFYIALLTALRNEGIEPYVTLYHWDLPQTFNQKTNTSTWLDPDIPNKFNRFADFCFKTFGHLVNKWLTFNEIITYSWLGYGLGVHAPGRCSPYISSHCQTVGGGGDTSTEPYISAHHSLIAHALAVQTYRSKYQKAQKGEIGMTINSNYFIPSNTSDPNDFLAANVGIAFQFGWFADPQVFGDYPIEMRNLITGGRLPVFNSTIKRLLKGSYDFLGLNFYTTYYIDYTGIPGTFFSNDGRFNYSPYNASGHLIGPFAASPWLNVYPPGFRGMLNWIKNRYGPDKRIYIFENGVSVPGESQKPLAEALDDTFRVNYIYDHIQNMLDAIVLDNVKVAGYFCWSVLDNFEWQDGFDVRFGITYVDFNNNLTRTPKKSACLYRGIVKYLENHIYQPNDHLPSIQYLSSL